LRVLISGATGFFGSQTALKLKQLGFEIVVLKRESSELTRLMPIIDTLKFYDLENNNIDSIFRGNDFDAVLHFATNYGRKGQFSSDLIYDNVFFSTKILEASILYNVPLFINIDTLLNPYVSRYSLSKKQFVEWGNFLALESKLKFVNLKFEHIYGPEDDESKFVNWVTQQMASNNNLIELTDGSQKRDFLFISDAVDAVIKVLQTPKLKYYDFEVGGGNLISVKDFILIIKEKLESKLNKKIYPELIFGAIEYRSNEQKEIKADISKIKELGWQSKVSIYDGIDLLIDFLLSGKNNHKVK
jgi:nucleoside-diphosphate-sugar epimerase